MRRYSIFLECLSCQRNEISSLLVFLISMFEIIYNVWRGLWPFWMVFLFFPLNWQVECKISIICSQGYFTMHKLPIGEDQNVYIKILYQSKRISAISLWTQVERLVLKNVNSKGAFLIKLNQMERKSR